MMQVENEYGSYGEDKAYLRAVRDLMIERGCNLSTLYLRWPFGVATLEAGTLIDEDLLVTGNFGSRADENFASMKEFFQEHDKKWPPCVWNFGTAGLIVGRNLLLQGILKN